MKKVLLLCIMLVFTSLVRGQINFDHFFSSLEMAGSDLMLDSISFPLVVLMPNDSVYKMDQSRLEPFEDKFVLIDKREKFIKRITNHYILRNYKNSKNKISYSLVKDVQSKDENKCPFEKLFIVYYINKKNCKVEISKLDAAE